MASGCEQICKTQVHFYVFLLAVNVGLAVGLSFGLFIVICFICIPIIICVSFFYASRSQRRPAVNTSSTTALTSNQNTSTSPKAITNPGLVYPEPTCKARIPLVPQVYTYIRYAVGYCTLHFDFYTIKLV